MDVLKALWTDPTSCLVGLGFVGFVVFLLTLKPAKGPDDREYDDDDAGDGE